MISPLQNELSWFVSVGFSITIVGTLIGGLNADRLGRKIAVLISCPVFIVGFLLSGLGQNVILLDVGAALLGLAIGLQTTPNLCYQTEVRENVSESSDN